MPLSQGFPGHNAAAAFADIRRDLEGTVVRDAAGKMRAGVFPAHFSALVTGRSDMKVAIADFRAVIDRGGAIFMANVGADTSVTLDAAPAANRRIDLIYAIQRSTTLGDAASTPIFGFVKGTASATPVAPSLPANLSTALPLATVEIPAGATTTLSAGVVITQLYSYTAMAGGTVAVRNSVELAAWAPADGSRAYCLADARHYVRAAGAWRTDAVGCGLAKSTAQSTDGSTSTWVAVSWDIEDWDRGDCHSGATPTRLTAPVAGLYHVAATLRFGSTTFGAGVALARNGVYGGGSTIERTAVYQAASTAVTARPHTALTFELAAGEYVEVMMLGLANNLGLTPAGCSASMVRVG